MAPSNGTKASNPTTLRRVRGGRVQKGRLAVQPQADDSEVDSSRPWQATPADNVTQVQGTNTAGSPVSTSGNHGTNHPVLLDGGNETIGEGAYQLTSSIKILQENSSMFFTGRIRKVDKSEASVRKFREEAAQYLVIRTSTVVRCADGKPVLRFLKAGMYAGLGPDKERGKREDSINAIRQLIDAYPPPPPRQDDSRMQQEQREIQKAQHQAFGRYMLAFWIPDGRQRKPPGLSAQSQPERADSMAKLVQYMQATEWEHSTIAKWISIADPAIHKELHSSYQGLGPGELQHLYQGPEACHSGLALLINRTEDPHKDSNDARDNWTTTNCWGSFTGGCVVYPELGIKVAMEPGDLSLTRAAVLTHFVEPVEEGERFCHVRFTKKNILRPTGKVYEDLAISCPMPGCAKVCPSEKQLKKHLHGPTGKLRRGKRTATYHWLENKEVTEYMARASEVPAHGVDEEEETGAGAKDSADADPR